MANFAQSNTACINAPSRKLFAPMFKARWQNMSNVVNDSAFIDLIPEPYLTYYMAFTRQCLQWSVGFVPQLHRQDFFSTGTGYTVIDILARECMSGGFRFESASKDLLNKMEHWKKAVNLDSVFYSMFWHSNSGGNSFIALTPNGGEVYPTAYPVNRCVFSINRRGVIERALILNRFTAGESAYYAKELRLMLNGKPFYKVVLAKGTMVTSPTWAGGELKTVPDEIVEQFAYVYGDIELGTWYKLPDSFSGVGVYNIRNKPVSAAISDMPGYADSSLMTALDILYAIDFDYTQSQVDMYMGKSRALIPKQYGGGNAFITTSNGRVGTVADGVSFSEAIQQPALKDDFYTEITTPGGETIKPTFIQAELRGEQHKFIRDGYLELLASKVGLSSSTLANHLQYNHDKTATQVEDEQTTTEKTVNQKRALCSDELNRMLTDVAKFYGYNDACIEIAWGRASSNTVTINDELLRDYQAHVLPLRKYLKKRWGDLSEEEIEEWAAEIEEEQRKQSERDSYGSGIFDDKNYFGGVADGENSTGTI